MNYKPYTDFVIRSRTDLIDVVEKGIDKNRNFVMNHYQYDRDKNLILDCKKKDIDVEFVIITEFDKYKNVIFEQHLNAKTGVILQQTECLYEDGTIVGKEIWMFDDTGRPVFYKVEVDAYYVPNKKLNDLWKERCMSSTGEWRSWF